MRTTMITRPGTAAPSQYGPKLSFTMQLGVARAKTAGVPPLTHLAKQDIPDDKLPRWRDALADMQPAELTVIVYWVDEYLPLCGNFAKGEDRERFRLRVIDSLRNCREIEIIEAFERILANKKYTRDEFGQITVEKLRDNPNWHPSWDQFIDAVEAAQRKYRSILRQLTQRCEETKERAAGLRQTLGQGQAIRAIHDRLRADPNTAALIAAEDREIDWQEYLEDRPARREALVAQFRRERDAAGLAVSDAEYAVRYYKGRPVAEPEARRRLARKQAEYDLAVAALKDSEADLAQVLLERQQRLAAPVKRLGRPQ